jgi:hypothetical protein
MLVEVRLGSFMSDSQFRILCWALYPELKNFFAATIIFNVLS